MGVGGWRGQVDGICRCGTVVKDLNKIKYQTRWQKYVYVGPWPFISKQGGYPRSLPVSVHTHVFDAPFPINIHKVRGPQSHPPSSLEVGDDVVNKVLFGELEVVAGAAQD